MYLSVLKLLSAHASPGALLLDVGCSFGGFLEQAQARGFLVRGMDIVPEAVEYVLQRGIPCDIAASIEELNLADNSIDIFTVLDCNYYWPDQRIELRALWRKLRRNGLLVMRVVDKSWMLSVGLSLRTVLPHISARICNRALNDHRVSIPLPSLLRLLAEEGFSVIKTSIWSALHSDISSPAVKAGFAMGSVVWPLSGWCVAPGALVLSRRVS